MPSPFFEALTAADALLDAHVGETVSIVPMRNTDFARGVDPERDTVDVLALVDFTDPSSADISVVTPRYAHASWQIEVRRTSLPDGFRLRLNDEVLLLDRPGSPRTKVTQVDNQDPTRLCAEVAPIGDVGE